MINALYIFLITLNFIFWIYLQKSHRDGVAITLNNIFFLFFMVIPGYIQYKSQAYPWLHFLFVNEDVLAPTLVLLIIYSFFLIVGYLSISTLTINVSNYMKNNNCTIAVIFVIIVSIPSIYLISEIGLTTFFSGREAAGEQVYNEADSVSMLYAFAKFSIYAILIGMIVISKRKSLKIKRTFFNFILFFYISSLNLIVNSPLSSPRFHFLGMLIGLLLVYGYLLRPIHRVLLSVCSPIFLYFIFPFTKTLGQNTSNNGINFESYITTGADYDCMVQMVNIFRYVSEGNYSFGSNILAGVAFFIPRAIWPDKPVHLGMLSSENIGLLYNNLSAPWPGELFYIFGFPSLIVGAFLTGVLFAKVDLSLFNKLQNTGYGLSVIFTGFIFIILRGSFSAVFPLIFLSLFVYFVFMQLANFYGKYSFLGKYIKLYTRI